MIIDKFGVPAVRNAWCDPNQVADDVLQGYTKVGVLSIDANFLTTALILYYLKFQEPTPAKEDGNGSSLQTPSI
jgi:hypothetical protein